MRTILLWITIMCCAIAASASVKGVYVDYTVNGKEYQGYLAYNPEQKGLRPAVVVFPEWWGVNDYVKSRARELAGLGYVAFVADMYGKGVVTTLADSARQLAGAFYQDFSKFETMTNAAFEQLLKQEHVDSAKTAAIGFCFGGTAALELARSGADLKGCITFHGGLGTPTPEKAKNIKCPVLVLRGDADPFDEPAYLEGFEKSMTEAGAKYKVVSYPGAKHAFTNPNAGKAGLDGVEYNEAAEKASMEEMRAFFREIFAGKQE
ncbi:dienelactone hydrolase family protein [bacterium]|nr:dienelactone hydrolase family protein [bacterium]